MSIWKQLYQAYENKDCNTFKQLWSNLSPEDKNSPYFSKYQSLYSKLCPPSDKKWKILLKWKTIKCPHCGAWISKSTFNLESIKKLKEWTKQVDFVCNYCWTKFTWSKKPFKNIFSDYTVGKKVEINWNTYKIAWWVKYKWWYHETWEWNGKLEYIEWLAYDKKWELFYISESRAQNNEWTYDEIEISKKVNFPFVIEDYDNYNIKTNKWDYLTKEIDTVRITEIYGEVNKWYKIWEEITIYNFEDYSLEIEKTENWIERNLYQRVNTKIPFNIWSLVNSDKIWEIVIAFIIWFAVILPFISTFISNILLPSINNKKIISKITVRQIKNIWTWYYEYDLFHPLTKTSYIESYDYGWKKYKKSTLKWFKFSIKNSKDKELFSKFIHNQNLINSFPKTSRLNNILTNNKRKIITSKQDLIIKYK